MILPMFFADTQACSKVLSGHSFFGLPHWWQYMTCTSDGAGGYTPQLTKLGDVFPLILAIINGLLWLAGVAAVIAIIIAGVSYITAIGNAEKITGSRKAIQNALIGLAIALIAAQVVAFIGRSLTK